MIHGIKEKKKKNEEVQNTLTLKSGGEKVSTLIQGGRKILQMY